MSFLSKERFDFILNNFNESISILVVGDVGLDKYTIGHVKRISPEAPVPVIEVEKENLSLGLAANITNNLNSLQLNSTLCGLIGKDNHGELLKNILKEKGVGLNGLIESNNRPTTYKERITTSTQQICRVDYESRKLIDVDIEKRIFDYYENHIDDHGAIILEDYGKGFFSQNLSQSLITLAREKGKILTIDPSRITPPEFYKGAMLLKPNKLEACAMARSLGCRSDELKAVATTLVEQLDLKMLVITLGADGMALMDREKSDELITIPTVANEVYDVSGAGDTSISVITASLLAGGSLEESVWMGNCASGVVVGKMGTATVSCEELKNYYLRLSKITF